MSSRSRAATACLLHAGLILFFRDVFVWYGLNSLKNPYYNFSLFYIGLWLAAQFILKIESRSADRPVAGLLLTCAAWSAYIIWKGPYISAVCFLSTSMLIMRWASPPACRRIDGLYTAVFLTLPFPCYVEVLSALQMFTLRESLALCRGFGWTFDHQGSLVFLRDGPVRIAAACSGFQSLVVFLALAGMLGCFLRLALPGKFLMLISALVIAIAFNIARVFAMLLVGNHWSVAAAEEFWHGVSAWLFYAGALGSMSGVGLWLRNRRRLTIS